MSGWSLSDRRNWAMDYPGHNSTTGGGARWGGSTPVVPNGEALDARLVAAVTLGAASASLLGAIVMLWLFARVKALRAFPARLAINLALVSLLWFSILVAELSVYFSGEQLGRICDVLGPVAHFCVYSFVAWAVVLAQHLRSLVASLVSLQSQALLSPSSDMDAETGQKYGTDGLEPRGALHGGTFGSATRSGVRDLQFRRADRSGTLEGTYHCLVWPGALLMEAIVVLYLPDSWYSNDDSGGTCFLRLNQPSTEAAALRLGTQTGPALLAIILIAVMYVAAYLKLREALPNRRTLARRVATSATRYLVIFVICWGSSVVDDIYVLAFHKFAPVSADLVKAALFYSQGWLIAVVYVSNRWELVRQSFGCCSRPQGVITSDAHAIYQSDNGRARDSYMSDASEVPSGGDQPFTPSHVYGDAAALIIDGGKGGVIGASLDDPVSAARSVPTPGRGLFDRSFGNGEWEEERRSSLRGSILGSDERYARGAMTPLR